MGCRQPVFPKRWGPNCLIFVVLNRHRAKSRRKFSGLKMAKSVCFHIHRGLKIISCLFSYTSWVESRESFRRPLFSSTSWVEPTKFNSPFFPRPSPFRSAEKLPCLLICICPASCPTSPAGRAGRTSACGELLFRGSARCLRCQLCV